MSVGVVGMTAMAVVVGWRWRVVGWRGRVIGPRAVLSLVGFPVVVEGVPRRRGVHHGRRLDLQVGLNVKGYMAITVNTCLHCYL